MSMQSGLRFVLALMMGLSPAVPLTAATVDVDLAGQVTYESGAGSRTIATDATAAWLIDDDKAIAYAVRSNREGEPSDLFLYLIADATKRLIYSAPFVVDDVQWIPLPRQAPVLLVSMHDHGLGASHFAIVDPERGQLLLRRRAEVINRTGSRLTVATYPLQEWGHPDAKPSKTENLDIATFAKTRRH